MLTATVIEYHKLEITEYRIYMYEYTEKIQKLSANYCLSKVYTLFPINLDSVNLCLLHWLDVLCSKYLIPIICVKFHKTRLQFYKTSPYVRIRIFNCLDLLVVQQFSSHSTCNKGTSCVASFYN